MSREYIKSMIYFINVSFFKIHTLYCILIHGFAQIRHFEESLDLKMIWIERCYCYLTVRSFLFQNSGLPNVASAEQIVNTFYITP